MAASQAKLREMFGAMSIEQKGQFIENLKKTLEGSTDFEDMQFLDECMMIYMMEVDALESGETSDDGTLADAEPETPVVAEAVVHVVSDDDFDISEVEPEVEVEPELVVEPEAEPVAEVEAELVAEPEVEFEPELVAEPEAEPVAEVEAELVAEPEVELEPELVAEPEAEPIAEPEEVAELVAEFEAEVEPELVSEPEVVVEEVAEVVDELETEVMVEDEFVTAVGSAFDDVPTTADKLITEDEAVVSDELSFDEEPMVEEFAETTASDDIVSAEISRPKIVNIEVRIAELYDNIGKNLSVIETISKLLSGTDSEIVDAVKQAQLTEPTELLDCASDYASKIEYIEGRFAELADSIRHDMSVIEGISNLLE
ncbi:MAG: hypothetical protein FWC13_06355 [Oscillospiraceae bacterium]|nr:hypothetical protein [Oscillospiraceae bacterium]